MNDDKYYYYVCEEIKVMKKLPQKIFVKFIEQGEDD